MRSLAAAVVLVSCVAEPARGADAVQPGVDVLAPAAGMAVMSANARFVAWVGPSSDGLLFVKDRQTAQLSAYELKTLMPAGSSARWLSRLDAISDDGRYLALTGADSSTYGSQVTAVRFDRQASSSVTLRRSSTFTGSLDPMSYTATAMSRDGRTLAWLEGGNLPDVAARVMLWRAADPVAREIGRTCVGSGQYGTVEPCISGPAVSGDGALVMYTAGSGNPEALAVLSVVSGHHDYFPEVRPATFRNSEGPTIATTGTGAHVLARSAAVPTSTPALALLDRGRRRVDTLPEAAGFDARAVSDDATRVLLQGPTAAVLDRASGLAFGISVTQALGFSASGRHVLGWYTHAGGGTDLRVVDLDADSDGMLDGWEARFGLDPTTATDATLDADGDGVDNHTEFLARSHPKALASATRLFAEGVGGAFFDTVVSVFNPGAVAADVVVRFLAAAGTSTSRTLRLAAYERTDLASCCIGTLEATEFAVVVESNVPVVADRRVTWDRVTAYGSHASTAVQAPATTWYFAEGATIGGLQTFLLLQNPGVTDGSATIEFLLADGTPATRTVAVPAASRRTVWVNQEGSPLDRAEFAIIVRTSVPMVAERAMYRDTSAQMFAAGTNAVGVTAPAVHWSFAEGTTRGGFDTFVLVANPSDAPVVITARFEGAGPAGVPVSVMRTYALEPRRRLTIWVDEAAAPLADAEFSTTISATAPIVAERAMWWRGGGADWIEGHVEFGATDNGRRFAVADAETNQATRTETFVLVGVADEQPALLRVTAYRSPGVALVRVFPATGSRTTIWMRQVFPELSGRYSVVVESLPVDGVRTPIFVERAMYAGDFASGAAARATMLPPEP